MPGHFKLRKENFTTMKHQRLMEKDGWYSAWHKNPYHKHLHWFLFFAVLVFFATTFNNVFLQTIHADQSASEPIINQVATPVSQPTENVIDMPSIAGVTIPATGATPTSTITDTTEYSATISWNGNPLTFASSAATAVITITPKTGYTLTGVPADFFTVAGATATNSADSGVVTAVFPVVATPVTTQAFVEYVVTPIPSGAYESGVIPISIVFNEPVKVIGSPQLTLAVSNSKNPVADYIGGSGTRSLIFSYKIFSGNSSSDFDYMSSHSLILNGGQIKNLYSDDADLSLPTPGQNGSISFNKKIVINTSLYLF